jgi:hypothetical protein
MTNTVVMLSMLEGKIRNVRASIYPSTTSANALSVMIRHVSQYWKICLSFVKYDWILSLWPATSGRRRASGGI